MSLTREETITQFEELKKKFGHTKVFQNFEKEQGENIKFLKFKQKHKLRWSKKTGWNKPFYPIVDMIWISDRKNYNKGLKKYGYYQNIQNGWKLGEDLVNRSRCKWCGKLLDKPNQKFCTDNDGRHRKLYSKIIAIGKKRHGFDIKKNNHILVFPVLYEYETSLSGILIIKPTDKKRIEFKDISFSINGKRYPLTTKGGKPRSKKKN